MLNVWSPASSVSWLEGELVALARRYDRLGTDAVAIPAAYTEAVAIKR